MKVFISVVFGLSFLFIISYFFMLIGLNISVEILNPDPSIYEDEEASSGIFLSSSIFAIIVGRYSYLAMEQKKFKNLYGDKEKDLTIIWIKCLVVFAIFTTCFDVFTEYYIRNSWINNLSFLWYFLSGFIAWFLFGRKYFNPLRNFKFFR